MAAVTHDWDFGNLDTTYLSEGLDLYESLNLEDLWKSVEIESQTDLDLADDTTSLDCKRSATMIRVHDCMWAGTCLSEDHVDRRRNETKITSTNSLFNSMSNCGTTLGGSASTRSTTSPVRIASVSGNRRRASPSPLAASSPRTVLRKTSLPAPSKVLHRPDTPPSEDELSKTPDDQDLSWLKGVALSEITGQRRRDTTNVTVTTAPAVANSVSFDHNYNSKQQPKMEDVGIDTPSDSEEEVESGEEEDEIQSSEVDDEDEEIDVVSCQPPSPPRRKQDRRQEEEWKRMERIRIEECRRREKLRVEQEWKLELSRQEQAKRPTSEVNKGRGRQKRKRTTSDEDELYRPETSYKVHGYRKNTGGRPRTAVRRKYAATTPSKKTRISTDSETDTTEKRSQHNNMERMRRIDLRNAFDELRNLIPSLSDANRAAKVTILRDAASYCLQLTSNSKTLVSQVHILRREQEKLRSNLSKLRRHIAYKHIGSAHR